MPQEPTTLRLLVAEDYALVREGTRNILNAEGDMEVVGAAADGEEEGAAGYVLKM